MVKRKDTFERRNTVEREVTINKKIERSYFRWQKTQEKFYIFKSVSGCEQMKLTTKLIIRNLKSEINCEFD